jgi:L-serine dehydratase
MIEVVEIDGARVSMAGDYYETLVFTTELEKVEAFIREHADPDLCEVKRGDRKFVEIKSQQVPEPALIDGIRALDPAARIKILKPVLPIMSRRDLEVPFVSCGEMLAFNKGKNFALWELAVRYEASRGGISGDEVFEKMRAIVRIMDNAIATGLTGTTYHDRILGSQSPLLKRKLAEKKLIGGDANNTVIMYVSAMMEVKSSMGVIVAAPTAGSCGALPGAVFGVAHSLRASEDEIVRAMLVAGLIGVFIAAGATFAAEVGGCMAETGSGGGMAAAAIVSMASGTLEQSIGAASLALQNSLGLICDPIGNRVEAPCLGRNVMAATNAVACANMALSDYAYLIPLDEVIATMKEVGDRIHHTLRCTNLGGLSVTPAAKEIEKSLASAGKAFFKNC